MRVKNLPNPGAGLGMPISAWPAPDREAWDAAFAPASLFSPVPGGADLRGPTREAFANAYARWLAWIKATHPEVLEDSPIDRATEERVVAFLNSLYGQLAAQAIFGYACRLKRTLELLAPAYDWSWFDPIITKATRKARAAKSVRRPFVPSDQLFALGMDVMQGAENSMFLTGPKQAEQFRDGLMVAFLASRPLRLKNMIGLEIGTQFLESGAGYEVALSSSVTKTHMDLGSGLID